MAALLSVWPPYVHLTPYIIPLNSDNKITLNVSSEGDETHILTVTLIPAGHCPDSVMLLLVSKEKSVPFYWRFQKANWSYEANQPTSRENLQEAAFHNFNNLYIDTTFCETDSNLIPCRKTCLSAIFQAVSARLCSFQNNAVTKLTTVMGF